MTSNPLEPKSALSSQSDSAPVRLKRLRSALTEDIATLPEDEFVEFIEDQLVGSPEPAAEFARIFKQVFETRKAWLKETKQTQANASP